MKPKESGATNHGVRQPRGTRSLVSAAVAVALAAAGLPEARSQDGIDWLYDDSVIPDDFHWHSATREELIAVGSTGSLARAVALSEFIVRRMCWPEGLEWARGGPVGIENFNDGMAIVSAAEYLLSCGVWDADAVARLRALVPGQFAPMIGRNGLRALCALGQNDSTVLDDLAIEARARSQTGNSIELSWVAVVISECDLGEDVDALLAYVAASPSSIIRLMALGAAFERQDMSLLQYASAAPEYSDPLLMELFPDHLAQCDGSWGDRCSQNRDDGSGDSPEDGSGPSPSTPNPPPSPLEEQPR